MTSALPAAMDAADYVALVESEGLVRQPRRRERGAYKANGCTYEADWMATVIQAAKWSGWWVYHTHSSECSEAGWPDLFCLRLQPDGTVRCLAIELKDEQTPPTPAQVACMALLRMVPGIEVFLLRTSDDWAAIERMLA